MLEAPGETDYPRDDLGRFRWHTGAELRPIARDEPCPVLFRDVGPKALLSFLAGTLERLAGPQTPITYLRTVEYQEPFVDHARTGRLVLLRPLALGPWHSGVPDVFVARATRTAPSGSVAFVPGAFDLRGVARLSAEVKDARELREALGGRELDARVEHERRSLVELVADLDVTEKLAEPLRRALQSAERVEREGARDAMRSIGLTEHDLCAAWHHLPAERRDFVRAGLGELRGRLAPCR